jgi:hypothetical protein
MDEDETKEEVDTQIEYFKNHARAFARAHRFITNEISVPDDGWKAFYLRERVSHE